ADAEQALRYFQRSLQVREDLLRANPDSAQAARDVSVSLNKLADFLRARGQAGDAEQALRYFQRSLQVREDLLRANPDSAQAARDLAISLERLAGMASQSDNPADRERGLAQQLRAVDIHRGLVARQGESYFFVRTLAVGLYLGGMYALQLDRQEEVQALLGELVALLHGWQQRGGTLDPQMAGLLEQLTGGAG
ncbi:hypothetical protein, partial [Sphaerotilus uruguayifluvii]|uniref:hypothetical protein n=1 Tax=Sphaerotilus uruguayifluvii TaxID=2735897 RepID=UPI001C2DE435